MAWFININKWFSNINKLFINIRKSFINIKKCLAFLNITNGEQETINAVHNNYVNYV